MGNNVIKGSIVWGTIMIIMLTLVLTLAPDITDFSLNRDGFEFKRPLIKAGEVPTTESLHERIPCNIMSLLEVKIEPVKIKAGETIKAQYTICNPDGNSTIAALGMSIQDYAQEHPPIIDTENDDLVYMVGGIATYERLFKIPENAKPAIYNIAMAVWEDVPGNDKNFQLGHTGWMERQLIVTENPDLQVPTMPFDNATKQFSKQFDEIKCNANYMVNNQIIISPEIVASLPMPELLLRANNLIESKQFDESLFFYYVASQIEPHNLHVWNGIGYTQTFVCNNNSSLQAYQNTLEKDANNVHALNGIGFYYTIQAELNLQNNKTKFLVKSNSENAQEYYNKVLQIDPHNVNALNGLGMIHTVLEEYDKAMEFLSLSYDLNANRIVTLTSIAEVYAKTDQIDKAMMFYQDALNIDANNFDVLLGLLTIYLREDIPLKADAILNQLIEYDEQVVNELIKEGKWLMNHEQKTEAKRFFETALEIDPKNKIASKLLSTLRVN